MPKPTEQRAPAQDEPLEDASDDVYDAPAELSDDEARRRDEDELSEAGAQGSARSPPPRPGALKLAIGIGAVLVVAAALLVYRAHHRRSVLDTGLAEAGRLVALDTAAGYREAASKLEPLAAMDPLVAASVRAFALGMLFADYRDAAAGDQAEALLDAPFRAREVPPEANLAAAALALGRREAGNALTQALRAGEGPSALALHARVAFQAGNLEAAEEPARAAAGAGLTAGLAIHGDVLRRARRDLAGAKAAYEAALSASPLHPRAAYGLAKLAHAGAIQPALAAAALERLLGDRATPAPERARAALHLAALRRRADDLAGARAALDAAGLEPRGRAWAERAASVLAEHRGPYRAVSGAPPSVQSASDDDPGVLSPTPPPPPAPPKPAVAAKPKPAKPAAKPAAKRTTTTKKKPSTRKQVTGTRR